jgi:uncharacterized protein YegL
MTTSRPGLQLARRPLHFFLLADCSGSMAADGKASALNTAVREMLPHLRNIAAENPHIELLFSSLSFSTGVQWHAAQPTPIDAVVWGDLVPDGFTAMGAALRAVAERTSVHAIGDRSLAPAIVLVSDGQPTDDFAAGLAALLDQPLGSAAARIAVAIGRDADRHVLTQFQGGGEPMMAHNPEQLVRSIRLASTAVTRAASELAPAAVTVRPMQWSSSDSGEEVW